jgi:hypothetical protein
MNSQRKKLICVGQGAELASICVSKKAWLRQVRRETSACGAWFALQSVLAQIKVNSARDLSAINIEHA